MSFEHALLIAWLAAQVACGGFERGDPTPAEDGDSAISDDDVSGTDDGGATVSYVDAVHPALVTSCNDCHGASGTAATSSFRLTDDAAADYDGIRALVDPSNAADSELLQRARGVGHTGGAVLTVNSDAYMTVERWIEEGASP